MSFMMDISTAVSLVNVAVLSVLLTLYGKIYSSTRAVYTLGLMFFAGMLMLHNAIAIYGYFAMAPLYAEPLLPYFIGVHFAELAGISALLKVTL